MPIAAAFFALPRARRPVSRAAALGRLAGAAGLVLALAGCGGDGGAGDGAGAAGSAGGATMSAQAQLGRKVFNDATLSASGRQSCASCHLADHAHSTDVATGIARGGVALERQGVRNVPSLRYLAAAPAFGFDDEGAPSGGLFWDGRAASLADQAGRPFVNPIEMANASRAEVVLRLARASYADEFRQLYGADIFERPDEAFVRMTLALQAFEQEDPGLHPFSSKYDDFLRGRATLTEQELRGLGLFNSPAKGNCAACHPSARGADGSLPLFTDFSYDNLGVPRNRALGVNVDPAHYDLGLCAREGGDLANRADLCGAFKVPSLRNVAQRKAYFHNARFTSLKEALTFYVQRETNPEKWYARNPDGTVDKYDDLPAQYRANVNTSEAPYDRRLGDAPALSDAEIDDLIAFLRTLDDGYVP